MKVAVFGGTGYVGSYIAEELIAKGHTPRLMVRMGSCLLYTSPSPRD